MTKYTEDQLTAIAEHFNWFVEQDRSGYLVWNTDPHAETGWTPVSDEQRAKIEELVGQTAYEVTASNHYHCQRLVVLAANHEEAWLKFWDYLRQHEQQVEEEKEYETAIDAYDDHDGTGTPPKREMYVYKFHDGDIREYARDHRWTGTPTTDVMAADGNG